MNPLDQLADISTPADISIWPLAWGYWVLLVLISVLVTMATYWLIQQHKRSANKRLSIAYISQLNPQAEDFCSALLMQWKQSCAHYFWHSHPMQLSGSNWQQFIIENYKGKDLTSLTQALEYLQQVLYAKPTLIDENTLKTNNEHLQAAVIQWLQSSTPPKTKGGLGMESKHV